MIKKICLLKEHLQTYQNFTVLAKILSCITDVQFFNDCPNATYKFYEFILLLFENFSILPHT